MPLATKAILCAGSLLLAAVTTFAQHSPAEESSSKPAGTTAISSAANTQKPPVERAWELLKNGVAEKSTNKREVAIRVLGLIPNSPESLHLAEEALADPKPEVRIAAATALGQMKAKESIPSLHKALEDPDTGVLLAVANALRELDDSAGYSIYYSVLSGELKSGKGLMAEQSAMLKDPKKMALFGFEQGIGQVPFAGIGYQAIKTLTKDDSSPVRAAAAKALANDPDPRTADALVLATADKNWLVRTAALDAIARRGDPKMIARIESSLGDEKDEVSFTAAAAIAHLASVPKPPTKAKPAPRRRTLPKPKTNPNT